MLFKDMNGPEPVVLNTIRRVLDIGSVLLRGLCSFLFYTSLLLFYRMVTKVAWWWLWWCCWRWSWARLTQYWLGCKVVALRKKRALLRPWWNGPGLHSSVCDNHRHGDWLSFPYFGCIVIMMMKTCMNRRLDSGTEVDSWEHWPGRGFGTFSYPCYHQRDQYKHRFVDHRHHGWYLHVPDWQPIRVCRLLLLESSVKCGQDVLHLSKLVMIMMMMACDANGDDDDTMLTGWYQWWWNGRIWIPERHK